ncbi:DUF397 domain-containing protein [Sphaerisporangium rhizosphaerae]
MSRRVSCTNRQCSAVARVRPGLVGVRDSKNPSGPILAIAATEWSAFLGAIMSGRSNA